MSTIRGYSAESPGGVLAPFEFQAGALGSDEVEVAVETCGVCHSDLSMLKNEWGLTAFPFVPGHEIIGKVVDVGPGVKNVAVGQTVGVGWFSGSCMTCDHCLSGDHNLCLSAEGVIVGRHGGFADKVRAKSAWVFPIPAGVNPETAGPLFCGGATVFTPILENDIRPTQRVGVVGIGGLGHMALGFLNKWGCHVTAFSTSPSKEAEARSMGAHAFVSTRDPEALAKVAGTFDMILVTVNVELDWDAYIAALRPRGVLHLVGAAPSVSASVFPLILGQKSIKGSPVGNPGNIAAMLEFCARHSIEPITEFFPMSKVNEAMKHLEDGKARYRIILKNDLDK
jgi:alcohol/geraniol dehydrogenase (NADP+)